MKMAERNALAELAEKLNADKDIVLAFMKDLGDKEEEVGGMMISDIRRASRIVAELAKPDRIDGRIAREIMVKCRAIAAMTGAEQNRKEGRK